MNKLLIGHMDITLPKFKWNSEQAIGGLEIITDKNKK